MDSVAPPIPNRSRQHGRRKSLPGPSAHTSSSHTSSSNRVHVQPASPEVISSLITSLSIISSPANKLFESPGPSGLPSPALTSGTYHTFGYQSSHNGPRSSGGSFGIDYGAFEQPSLRELVREESLDELAASPPVVRTAKPPSGFSPLSPCLRWVAQSSRNPARSNPSSSPNTASLNANARIAASSR